MTIAVSEIDRAENEPSERLLARSAADAALADLFRVAMPIAERLLSLKENTPAGSVGCLVCAFVGQAGDFALGRRGHRYCPRCGEDATARGWWEGDRGGVHRPTEHAACTAASE